MLMYVLSYAPVVRMIGGWDTVLGTDGFGNPAILRAPIYSDDLPAYRPVEWLIDHTPMREPLLWWADICGVGRPFREAESWHR